MFKERTSLTHEIIHAYKEPWIICLKATLPSISCPYAFRVFKSSALLLKNILLNLWYQNLKKTKQSNVIMFAAVAARNTL